MKREGGIHPLPLALEIMRFRKEKHPMGSNFTVRVRLGHAEIRDETAIADLLAALYELGYEVVKKSAPAGSGPSNANDAER